MANLVAQLLHIRELDVYFRERLVNEHFEQIYKLVHIKRNAQSNIVFAKSIQDHSELLVACLFILSLLCFVKDIVDIWSIVSQFVCDQLLLKNLNLFVSFQEAGQHWIPITYMKETLKAANSNAQRFECHRLRLVHCLMPQLHQE